MKVYDTRERSCVEYKNGNREINFAEFSRKGNYQRGNSDTLAVKFSLRFAFGNGLAKICLCIECEARDRRIIVYEYVRESTDGNTNTGRGGEVHG